MPFASGAKHSIVEGTAFCCSWGWLSCPEQWGRNQSSGKSFSMLVDVFDPTKSCISHNDSG